MSYELFVGPEVKGCKAVALIDTDTQTQLIEGRWTGEVLTIDKPDSMILGARSLQSVEYNLRACLREADPFADVVVNVEDFGAVPDIRPALATQVGGSHYKDMLIQPAEYCHKNGIGKLEGDVIAYVSRWRKKNGIEDLKKARHTIDIIIELEGGETDHG